jgi:hypothetical protein
MIGLFQLFDFGASQAFIRKLNDDIGGYFIRGIKPDTLRAIDKDKYIIL